MDIEAAANQHPENIIPENRFLEPLVDISRFQMPAGAALPSSCLRCGGSTDPNARFRPHPLRPADSVWGRYPEASKLRLGLCAGCFFRVVLLGTPEGRLAVESYLKQEVPVAYRNAEYESYRAYSDHLADVYNKVMKWCADAVEGKSVRSFYLYSQPGPWGSGCGNGKSMLMWMAFKCLMRRGSYIHEDAAIRELKNLNSTSIEPLGFVCNLKTDLCDPFLRARCRFTDMDQQRFYKLKEGLEGDPELTGIDDLVERLLGDVPYLFLDDVGRDKPGVMSIGLYEKLLDLRGNNLRPTFITSNYSPEKIGQRIGAPAASRLLRVNCEVVEVQAPDFSLVKHRLGPV